MTVLAADRETSRKEPGYKACLMGTDIIYKGGMVCYGADGLAVAAADTKSFTFAGVAAEKVDDSAGAGTKWCKLYTEGLFLLVATSITQAMVGQMMYVADDQTYDDTSTHLIPCGILIEYVSATSGWIDIGPACQSGTYNGKVVLCQHVNLVDVTAADVATDFIPGFAGKVDKVFWVQGSPVTTASDLASLVVDIEAVEVTGGLVALTSATCTPLGVTINGSAVTGTNVFDADEKLSIRAETVTAFAEGDGMLYIVCSVRGL